MPRMKVIVVQQLGHPKQVFLDTGHERIRLEGLTSVQYKAKADQFCGVRLTIDADLEVVWDEPEGRQAACEQSAAITESA